MLSANTSEYTFLLFHDSAHKGEVEYRSCALLFGSLYDRDSLEMISNVLDRRYKPLV